MGGMLIFPLSPDVPASAVPVSYFGEPVIRLEWTTERPVVPGWYLAQPIEDKNPEHVLVDYKFRVWRNSYLSSIEWGVADFSHWLGPLPVLEPPKE